MKRILKLIFGKRDRNVSSREEAERIKFSGEARKQLVRLKEKGLSIPIFTL